MAIGSKAKELITKIKSIKHIEIIIAIIAVALMILIFSGLDFTKSKTSSSTSSELIQPQNSYSDASISAWEEKLSNILSQIDGVGKAEVMITAKSSEEKITAKTTTTNTSSSQNNSGNLTTSTNTTESPVIVNNNGTSEPYVLKEIMPEIIGVIVVAEGADSAITKLAIMRAVQTVLHVDASCVEIYPMK